MVRKLLEGFWQVCDRDGSGSIDLEEYLFLHLNLYAAMNVEATQKEGWQDEARVVATREWDFDRQGFDSLNRDRFFTSFYQIVDAWLVGPPTTEAYVKFLCFLLDRITVQDDDPDDGKRQVKLTVGGGPAMARDAGTSVGRFTGRQPRRVAACVEINQCVGCTRPCWLRRAVRNRHGHAIEQERAVKF